MPAIDLNDKFKGCLVGSAIGDALGYSVEFSSMAAIYAKYGDEGITELQPRPYRGGRLALYSDDTQMARAVAEGLISAGSAADLDASAHEVKGQFIKWLHHPENTRAPGGACLAGCRKLEAGVPWRKAGGINTNKGAGGCGSVMRAHPYGLFHVDSLVRAYTTAAEHSKLTHGAPLAQAASAALAAGVWTSVRNWDIRSIATAMQDAAYHYDEGTGDMLVLAEAMVDAGKPTSEVLDMWRGWAGHEAIAAALFVFLKFNAFGIEEVARVGANSPGDSDSIAAIACALSGAFHGYESLDEGWVAKLEKSDELEDLAVRLRVASTASPTLYILHKEPTHDEDRLDA